MIERIRAVHRVAVAAAAAQDGVASRRMLRAAGIDRDEVRGHVRAGRWREHGRWTIAVHTGDLSLLAERWRAVWEVGERIAVVDGVSALHHRRLTGFSEPSIHVSVPHTARTHPVDGVVLHKVRTRPRRHVSATGLPVAAPGPAAVRGAHWARSDRQAALIMVLPVQQGLVTGDQLVVATREVRGRTRRKFIRLVAADIAGGAQALSELDFARICRIHGLPEPPRQVVRRGPRGRTYLDVRWACGLVVEIDGAGHRWGLAVSDDNLRHNFATLAGDTVLRIDTIGLRTLEEDFMAQVVTAHRRLTSGC